MFIRLLSYPLEVQKKYWKNVIKEPDSKWNFFRNLFVKVRNLLVKQVKLKLKVLILSASYQTAYYIRSH